MTVNLSQRVKNYFLFDPVSSPMHHRIGYHLVTSAGALKGPIALAFV
jgi:hypothetical protein